MMSDKMTPIAFGKLMNWVLAEHKKGSIFGIKRAFRANSDHSETLFDHKLETPFGPAAGPHTQLAQNIIAAYVAGGRFFELKTVQKLDGADITVAKPCIKAEDECYNVEWSTELTVHQAFEEYLKAWFVLKVIAKEFDLGAMDGFQFNMSVGYDLAGIKSPKIDNFIDNLKDAARTPAFQGCRQWLLVNLNRFQKITREDVLDISPQICNSVTLSTMHGCPSKEIESIAKYLLLNKKLNTFIKCNPTLLGYEYVRKTLDAMGYGYVAFKAFHFKNDLQYIEAVPMLKRLQKVAEKEKLTFGVKLTNTFPVEIKGGELPGQEMYMAGKPLCALALTLALRLAKSFNGKLRISYSGGADFFNICQIVETGIWPVTMATNLLKPGGYQRLEQIGNLFAQKPIPIFRGINITKLEKLVEETKIDPHRIKSGRGTGSRKIKAPVPLTDCFFAPCQAGCPIHQDIPAYLQLLREGKQAEALQVILSKNPLPFITGTICPHKCMSKCLRNFYETPVNIRQSKLIAAEGGFDQIVKTLHPGTACGKKAVVVGGGPAGMAAAYFLARGGIYATILEQTNKLGGTVRHIIPKTRINDAVIDHDVELLKAMKVTVELNHRVEDMAKLVKKYDYVILALGTSAHSKLLCQKMGLADSDAKGSPKIPVASEIVPTGFYQRVGIAVDATGKAQIDTKTMATNIAGVYVVGDGASGPSTVVESIAGATRAAQAILGHPVTEDTFIKADEKAINLKKGITSEESATDYERCLKCDSICEICTEVCPNRANIAIAVPGMDNQQIIHIDYLCNECGNCRSFCPWNSAPYKDKFTLFANKADMENSENQGFTVVDKVKGLCVVRVGGKTVEYILATHKGKLPEDIVKIIETVVEDYSYLL